MNSANRSNANRRSWAFRTAQFALLWSRIFVVILLIAGVEGLVIWCGGFRYQPKSAACRVWTGPLSIDREGSVAAACLKVMQSRDQGYWTDVVFVDLRGRKIATLGARDLEPQVVALSPSGDAVAFSGLDGVIYGLNNYRPSARGRDIGREQRFASVDGAEFTQLLFSPDGKLLAADSKYFAVVWEWPTGKLLQCFEHAANAVDALSFSSDSRQIITPGPAGRLHVWNARSGEPVRDLPLAIPSPAQIALDPTWEHVALTDVLRADVGLTDSAKEHWQRDFSCPVVGLDSQRKRLAVAATEGVNSSLGVYELGSGQPICPLDRRGALVTGLAFAPDGALLSWDLQGHIEAWDVDRREQLWSLSLSDFQSQLR